MPDPVTPAGGATPPAAPTTPQAPAGATPPAAPTAPVGRIASDDADALRRMVEDQFKEIEALKKETIERRQRLKPLESLEEALRKALQIPEGQTSKAIEDAVGAQQDKMRKALVRGKALALAGMAGSLDPELAVSAMDLSKVEVDLESMTVKDDHLKAEVTRLKKEKPFLFPSAAAPAAPMPPAPGAPTPTPARPEAGGNGGGSPGEEYVRLVREGRTKEAQQVYLANRAAVAKYLEANQRS